MQLLANLRRKIGTRQSSSHTEVAMRCFGCFKPRQSRVYRAPTAVDPAATETAAAAASHPDPMRATSFRFVRDLGSGGTYWHNRALSSHSDRRRGGRKAHQAPPAQGHPAQRHAGDSGAAAANPFWDRRRAWDRQPHQNLCTNRKLTHNLDVRLPRRKCSAQISTSG